MTDLKRVSDLWNVMFIAHSYSPVFFGGSLLLLVVGCGGEDTQLFQVGPTSDPASEVPIAAPAPLGLSACDEAIACDELPAIIETKLDVERIEACSSLRSLFIRAGTAASIELPCLETVRGGIAIQQNGTVREVRFPALRQIDGQLAMDFTTRVVALELPSLDTIGGDLNIGHNDALSVLELPRLTTIGGMLHVADDAALARVSLPALSAVGRYVYIGNNRSLSDLSIDSLRSVGAAPLGAGDDYLRVEKNGGDSDASADTDLIDRSQVVNVPTSSREGSSSLHPKQ